MSQDILETDVLVTRAQTDRRSRRQSAPPYLSEEGLVLIDRREGGDRRAKQTPKTGKPQPTTSDLVLQRMKQLADLYGYRPAPQVAENDCLKEITEAGSWYQPATTKWEDAA